MLRRSRSWPAAQSWRATPTSSGADRQYNGVSSVSRSGPHQASSGFQIPRMARVFAIGFQRVFQAVTDDDTNGTARQAEAVKKSRKPTVTMASRSRSSRRRGRTFERSMARRPKGRTRWCGTSASIRPTKRTRARGVEAEASGWTASSGAQGAARRLSDSDRRGSNDHVRRSLYTDGSTHRSVS